MIRQFHFWNKYLYTVSTPALFTVSSHSVDTVQVSIDRWMDKQDVLYSDYELLVHLKKEGTAVMSYNTEECWRYELAEISQGPSNNV